jgi:hypothetical protein
VLERDIETAGENLSKSNDFVCCFGGVERELFPLSRLKDLLMKLILLISIADMDRPSLRQHDEVVIGEDAKDRLEAKL